MREKIISLLLRILLCLLVASFVAFLGVRYLGLEPMIVEDVILGYDIHDGDSGVGDWRQLDTAGASVSPDTPVAERMIEHDYGFYTYRFKEIRTLKGIFPDREDVVFWMNIPRVAWISTGSTALWTLLCYLWLRRWWRQNR